MGSSKLRGGGWSHDGPAIDSSPHPQPSAQRRRLRHPQPAQAVPHGGALLPLLAPRHLLEVRDAAQVQVAGVVQPVGDDAPPEVRPQVAAECSAHRGGADVVLDAFLGDAVGLEGGAVEWAGRAPREPGRLNGGFVVLVGYGYFVLINVFNVSQDLKTWFE